MLPSLLEPLELIILCYKPFKRHVEVLPSGEVGWNFFEVFDRQRREPGLFRRWEGWQGCESLEGLASVSPGIPVDEAMGRLETGCFRIFLELRVRLEMFVDPADRSFVRSCTRFRTPHGHISRETHCPYFVTFAT